MEEWKKAMIIDFERWNMTRTVDHVISDLWDFHIESRIWMKMNINGLLTLQKKAFQIQISFDVLWKLVFIENWMSTAESNRLRSILLLKILWCVIEIEIIYIIWEIFGEFHSEIFFVNELWSKNTENTGNYRQNK